MSLHIREPEITPAMVRHHTGIQVPDNATDIQLENVWGGYEPVGKPVKKLVPENRFSWGWPTYVEIETQPHAKRCFVSWRVGDERFSASYLK